MRILFIFALMFTVFLSISTYAQDSKEKGRISGKIVEKKTGGDMIGARVMIKDTKMGAVSKFDGSYLIKNVPPGEYTLVFSYVGYAKKEVTNVVVEPNDVTKINISMQEEVLEKDEVVVTAKSVKETGAALLKERQKAEAFSDAIGAEEISRTGGGNAADAIKQLTGAATVGGKHVYIRGLGDRYSNTQLNGADLPTADPDKKSVHLDLFPTNLIENITTVKTATPDKPGSFTGGTVNISTRSYPEEFSLNFSLSSSYNDQTSFSDDFLGYSNSSTDWVGFDNGKRSLPGIVKNNEVPDYGMTYADDEAAHKLDKMSKAFNNEMAPKRKHVPMNSGFSLSAGDQFELFGNSLGFFATLSYDRKYKLYNNGDYNKYVRKGEGNNIDSLRVSYDYADNKGEDEALWGSMVNAAYNFHENHQITYNYMRNQSGLSQARYMEGIFPDDLNDIHDTMQTRALKYTERSISSNQLKGEHFFPWLLNSKLDWNFAYNVTSQDEPDMRFFNNDFHHWSYYDKEKGDTVSGTTHYIHTNLYSAPTRYYRQLEEKLYNFNVNFEIPLKEVIGAQLKFKTGFSYQDKFREFREKRYLFKYQGNDKGYYGDPFAYFSQDNMGIVGYDSLLQTYQWGVHVVDATEKRSSYDGERNIQALYGMIDWYIYDNLRIIGGARYETTDLWVASHDPGLDTGEVEQFDLLPSVNLVYQLFSNMNLRAAYGKTVARPTMRELAPYPSLDFIGSFIFLGNPNLKRTIVDNYDIRWEWFLNPGEIIAVSGFYKSFKNSIERVIKNENGEINFQNVDDATVYGLEFEFRKNLGTFYEPLKYFQTGFNVTLIHSEVKIAEDELKIIREYDPNASAYRPLQGQSPYIVNFDLGYVNPDWGTTATLHYYVFGKRLSEVSPLGAPDVYQFPEPDLNIVVSQRLFDGFKVKASAKNLLNAGVKKAQEFKGKDYIYYQYNYGRTFSIGISYSIN